MYSVDELNELEDILSDEFSGNPLTTILTYLNRMDQLDELLQGLKISFSTGTKNSSVTSFPTGKILVFGESRARLPQLKGVIKQLHLDFERFEFHLEYNDIKTFDFNKLQWSSSYAAILIGPVPHSGLGKGNYGSIISALEQEDGYPPIVRLEDANGLKITKSSFEKALTGLLEKKVIKSA